MKSVKFIVVFLVSMISIGLALAFLTFLVIPQKVSEGIALVYTEAAPAEENCNTFSHIEVAVSMEVTPTSVPLRLVCEPVAIIKHANSTEDVEYMALSLYYSPASDAYNKFLYMAVVYNRLVNSQYYDYGSTIKEVVSDKNEFPWWSSKVPCGTKSKEIYRKNLVLADLFFDYVKSCEEQKKAYAVCDDALRISWGKNSDGLNRFVLPLDFFGEPVAVEMSEEKFQSMLYPILLERLEGE